MIAVIFSHTISESYRIGEYAFFEFGSYGVYLFFILSAYLITSQLLETQDARVARCDGVGAPLWRFYSKRILRLFPAYYLAIIVTCVFGLGTMRQEFPWHALQMSDLLFALDPQAENDSPGGHLWSLSVEWQFYLWWPLIVFLLPRAVPWVIAGMFAASLYAWSPVGSLPPVVERTNILQSLDSLAFGAALAFAQHRRAPLGWLRKAVWPAAAVTAAGVGLFMLGHGRTGNLVLVVTHEAMNLFFAAIIYRATSGYVGISGRMMDNATLQYIGRISYGIYVYHGFILATYFVATTAVGVPAISWGIGLTIFLSIVSIATAGLSWRFMELPINSLRRHFHYRAYEPAPAQVDETERRAAAA